MEVLGLSSPPQPGDTFQVIDDPIKARQVVNYRQTQAKEALGGRGGRLTLESLQQMSEAGSRAADHHQGRRAGIGRGAGRHADQAH